MLLPGLSETPITQLSKLLETQPPGIVAYDHCFQFDTQDQTDTLKFIWGYSYHLLIKCGENHIGPLTKILSAYLLDGTNTIHSKR